MALAVLAVAGFVTPLAAAAGTHTSKAASDSVTPKQSAATPIGDAKPIEATDLQSGRLVVHTDDYAQLNSALQGMGQSINRVLDDDLGVYEVVTTSPDEAIKVRKALLSSGVASHVDMEFAPGKSPRERMIRSIRSYAEYIAASRNAIPGVRINSVPPALRPIEQQTENARGASNDPFFFAQWHFENTADPDPTLRRDNNILGTIYTSRGLSGQGVNVAFSNFGANTHPDLDHTELDGNFSSALTMPFDPNLLDDSIPLTAWAGIVAAERDGVAIQGIAPNAKFGLFNWAAMPNSIPLYDYEAFNWMQRELDIKVFNTGAFGFYSAPVNAYNRGAISEYVTIPLRNSYFFGRERRGTINIFGTGTSIYAGISGVPGMPDPYTFPPASPGDSWSPIDAWAQSQNSVGVSVTNNYVSGPFYPTNQVAFYPPANDRRNFIVTTLADDGFADSFAGLGASVFCSVYGGTANQYLGFTGTNILTTSPGGLVDFFPSALATLDGTENMSGPMVAAGIISLMLDANPTLSIRDIQHILFESIQESPKDPSVKWPNFDTDRGYYTTYNGDPTFAPPRSFWQTNTGLYSGGPVENQAIRHSDIYGFGVVDADLAVQKAANWQGTPKLILLDTGHVGSFNDPDLDTEDEIELEIPDAEFEVVVEPDGDTGSPGLAVMLNAPVALPNICVRQNIRIEAVVLELTIEGSMSNDLYIELTSPSGTRSILQLPTTANPFGTTIDLFPGDDDVDSGIFGNADVFVGNTRYALYRHEFLSWKHWGELSGGNWTITFADFGPDDSMPEGEPPTDSTPGADMVVSLGENGVPGNPTRSTKTVTGYRFRIYGTDVGAPIFEGCPLLSTSCPADLDGNGIIDVRDLQIFVEYYFQGNALADLDQNGSVDYNDLVVYRGLWTPGFCNSTTPFTGGRPVPGNTNIGGDNNPRPRPI